MYIRKPDRYKHIDAGDISAQLEVKERLQCKPFSYFLEVVAPDMLEKYPPTQTEFASGVVSFSFQSFFIKNLTQLLFFVAREHWLPKQMC